MSLLQLVKGKYFGSRYGQARQGAAQALGAGVGATFTFDVDEFDNCTLLVSMTGSATGDLLVWTTPSDVAGATFPLTLVPVMSVGPTVAAPNVCFMATYDTRGLSQIVVSVKNQNAAGQTINFVDILAGITGCDSL